MQETSIVIPTYNRPKELARLLEFLFLSGNHAPVWVLDGGSPENQKLNAGTSAKYSVVRHRTYPSASHLGLRIADGLQHVDTPYMTVCADDDFVYPAGLGACAEFLSAHPDYSVALGRVQAISYFKDKLLFNRGILLDDPLGFVGYMAHDKFLQRSLYYFAYTHLGSTPLFYGVRSTDLARRVFGRVTAGMKYTGMELLGVTMMLIEGKAIVLDVGYGLRDYSCVSTSEPLREGSEGYFAAADLDYLRPLFVEDLMRAEHLARAQAERDIDLHMSQFARAEPAGLPAASPAAQPAGQRIRLAARLMRSVFAPVGLGRRYGIPAGTMGALMQAHRNFVR
jgi:glycosyltransferase domain-containing protein